MSELIQRIKALLKTIPAVRSAHLYVALRREQRRTAAAWADTPLPVTGKAEPETLVFSRYGTETVGNCFIQLGLLRALFQASPARPVFLLSTDRSLTRAGLSGIQQLLQRTPGSAPLARYIDEKVSVVEESKIHSIAPRDLLVLGGGPIMDDPALSRWLIWFQRARRAGARTMIAGCGLGPLRHPMAISITRSLLALTDVAVIRNHPQETYLRAANSALQVALDPAFLCLPFLAPLVGPKRNLLAVNTRTVGVDSAPDRVVTSDEVVRRVLDHALQLAHSVKLDEVVPFSTCEHPGAPDSVLAIRAAEALANRLQIPMQPCPETTVTGIVDAMLPAQYVLSTRMHGFIIGLMLGCRSANLDYIGGGGKGTDIYRDWFGRDAAPSLFVPGSLRYQDFLSLSELIDPASIDTLFETYVSAFRQALAG